MKFFGKLAVLAFVAGVLFLASANYIELKAIASQYLLQRAWAKTLDGEKLSHPWPWSDSYPVARIVMNRLDVDLIVQEGDQGAVLAFGPGHQINSTLPPSEGNCVVVGHRDTSFKFLQYVEIGDVFKLQSSDGSFHYYKVETRDIINYKELYFSRRPAGLSLVTCYPFNGVNPATQLRYVVTARKIGVEESVQTAGKESVKKGQKSIKG